MNETLTSFFRIPHPPWQSSQQNTMKFYLWCVFTRLVVSAPFPHNLPTHMTLNPPTTYLQKRSLEIIQKIPYCNPKKQGLKPGVIDDGFVADISYPTHFLPVPMPISTDRPQTPLENNIYDITNDQARPLAKRSIDQWRSGKPGITKFLQRNKFAILGAALVTGGGLWVWERWRFREKKGGEKIRMMDWIKDIVNLRGP